MDKNRGKEVIFKRYRGKGGVWENRGGRKRKIGDRDLVIIVSKEIKRGGERENSEPSIKVKSE